MVGSDAANVCASSPANRGMVAALGLKKEGHLAGKKRSIHRSEAGIRRIAAKNRIVLPGSTVKRVAGTPGIGGLRSSQK